MSDNLSDTKNMAMKIGKISIDVVNFLMIYFVVFILIVVTWTKYVFGDVSLPQLLFFLIYGGSEGVEISVVLGAVWNVVCLPLLMTLYLFYVFKKKCNRLKTFVCSVLGVIGVFTSNYCSGITKSLLCFSETKFYEENYKFIKNIKIDEGKKRNVIIVFMESFENKYANVEKDGNRYKVLDDDVISFSNLTEGFSQNWTQGALFSAFTGVHIHYISDFFRYGVKNFKFNNEYKTLIETNNLGKKFNFDTPNIRYLGDITKANGYNNLFMKGGEVVFSGTDRFLYNHGFDRKNVFDANSYKGTEEYKKVGHWWGVRDKVIFNDFKNKITNLDKEKPFFAVMFTLDLHLGKSPYFDDIYDEAIETISNLNDFIKWFKEQEWAENTTLVVVGDHKRMGENVENGGDIYNAFINLPERLREGINTKRDFQQIDMFPTVLDIMGVELEDGRAGVGVSLFSKNKTLAEKYSYEEQKELFSKIDRFYQKIWEEKEPIWGGDVIDVDAKEKFIAHAGGVIDGKVYTNSLEAMERSKQRGYKYIELDMIANKSSNDKIVAMHDCGRFYNMSLKKCNEKLDFEKDKLLGKYSILDDEKILKFFSENEDLWLVTDKIDDFLLLDEKFGKIKNRMLVEVFSYKKYIEARKFGFENIALNVKTKKDVEIALDRGIEMVTMVLDFAKNNEREILRLKNNGIKILGYSAKNFDEIRKFDGKIDMFYYDGEEDINTYFR